MVDPITIPLIAAALDVASSAAATTTTNAVTQFNSENDAFTASILNLSRCSFKRIPGTGNPVRGQWMQAPSDLTSLFDLVKEHPNATKEDIEKIVTALGDSGHDLRPWSICTLAKAGGLWGPAALISYDVFDRNGKPTGDLLAFMMLIRPGWEYTAGVAMGPKDWIASRYDFMDNNGWSLYKAVEDLPNPDKNTINSDMQKVFSEGEYALMEQGLNRKYDDQRVRISFQPGKVVRFKIENVIA